MHSAGVVTSRFAAGVPSWVALPGVMVSRERNERHADCQQRQFWGMPSTKAAPVGCGRHALNRLHRRLSSSHQTRRRGFSALVTSALYQTGLLPTVCTPPDTPWMAPLVTTAGAKP